MRRKDRSFYAPVLLLAIIHRSDAAPVSAAVGRRQGVRPTSHSEGTFGPRGRGSGRSEASPTAIPQNTHSVEKAFSDVAIRYLAKIDACVLSVCGFRPRGSTHQTPYVVVSDKNARLCMRSCKV